MYKDFLVLSVFVSYLTRARIAQGELLWSFIRTYIRTLKHLLWNYMAKFNETSQEASLGVSTKIQQGVMID